MISNIIFCLCLFVGLWFTVITGVRVCYKLDLVGYQLLILAAAWTGVITHLMHIW